jgi:hypothetical protein
MEHRTIVCSHCRARPAAHGKAECIECIEYHRNRYAQRLAANICVYCGKEPAAPGRSQGKKCLRRHKLARRQQRDEINAYVSARRARRLEQGLCNHCGKRPAAPGRVRCGNCTEYFRSLRKQAAAAGLCVKCRERPVNDGRLMCDYCRRKSRAQDQKKRDRGLCPSCGKPHAGPSVRCQSCTDKHKQWRRRVRNEVFVAYGGIRCTCCGVTEPVFLEIDHIDNNGAEHRRSLGNRGTTMYLWLRNNGFPPGFQVLCCNCNRAKQVLGICPHQLNKEVPQCLPQPETAEAK